MTRSYFVHTLFECLVTLFVIYRILRFFHFHKGWVTLLGLFSALLFFLSGLPDRMLASVYGLKLYINFQEFLILCLTFHPEIKWFINRYAYKSPEYKFLERNGPLDELVKACGILASSNTGALIAIKRTDDLSSFIEKSVVIDALVRHELLLTIFTPPTYLHDGGVIIFQDRIVACSAIFPLTQNPELSKDLGTRHRAALGMSEETDALCIVVSEETGAISITDRGKLYYDLKLDTLKGMIEKFIRFKNPGWKLPW